MQTLQLTRCSKQDLQLNDRHFGETGRCMEIALLAIRSAVHLPGKKINQTEVRRNWTHAYWQASI